MSKTKPFGADRCPNCGEYGSHYCGPSFGDKGFFICRKKSDKYKAEAEQCPYCNQKTFNNPCGHCNTYRGI